MKPAILNQLLPLLILLLFIFTRHANAGVPCAHILICCRETNKGITFLVNGNWNRAHGYGDINQVSDILEKIKNAGIKIVIIDMTNESQWNQYWNQYKPMVDNIQQICSKKHMQLVLFIGASGGFSVWNEKAGRILDLWANKPSYRKYGFGDDRPLLIVFQPSDMYWEKYDQAPNDLKNNLQKFHIGTTQVNDPILPGKSDGWGYRNYSQNVDGTVRFVSPNGSVAPDSWYHISGAEWKRRVTWAKQAEHYSIYGSYDDTCDGIHWGIADTKKTDIARNKYPGDEPFTYYNIVREALTRNFTRSPLH